jgi:peroxiredoxin
MLASPSDERPESRVRSRSAAGPADGRASSDDEIRVDRRVEIEKSAADCKVSGAGPVSFLYPSPEIPAVRYWSAVALLLLAGIAGAASSTDVPSDPAKVVPLPVGSAMPAVVVRNPDGTEHRIGPGPLARPVVLIFYRGGWCPYCNRHLGALKKIEPDLVQLGYDLLFLSADRPEILYSSLKEPDVHYTLLSDATLSAARAYHVAYHLDAAAMAKYGEYGVDLEAASGQTHHQLPVPAVFIIDRAGVIRFVYANPDYTVRITPPALLEAAQKVASR